MKILLKSKLFNFIRNSILKRKFRVVLVVGIVSIILMMVPLTVAAATNTEIIAIMKEGLLSNAGNLKDTLKSNLDMVKMAYCASGITSLC